MITVTESAKEELKKTLLAHVDNPEVGLRLTIKPAGQLGLVLEREAPGDQVVEHAGSKVLLVGHEVAEQVAEQTLDTHDTPEGSRLTISRE